MEKIIRRVKFDEENGNLKEFHFEINAIITEIMERDGLWGKLEGENTIFPTSSVAIQITGLGDKNKKVPLEIGDRIKIIIKYKKENDS